MPRGKFIAIDGGEGVGKTTVCRSLKLRLPEDQFIFIREPGGTPLGDVLRSTLLDPAFSFEMKTEFLMFLSSRVEIVEKVIRPALRAGQHVIADRFDSSTFAYQIWGRENYLWRPIFAELRNFVCEDVTPDLYLFMQLDPSKALQRISQREGNNHFDNQKTEFHDRVLVGYQKFFESQPHVKVDAGRSESEVLDEIETLILKFTGTAVSKV